MAKEARAGLVDVRPATPTHRLFVTERGEVYEQDASLRILKNGVAVSRAPLAAFGVPELSLADELRTGERAAFLFVRHLAHGLEAYVLLTSVLRDLDRHPVTTPASARPTCWIALAAGLAAIVPREVRPSRRRAHLESSPRAQVTLT